MNHRRFQTPIIVIIFNRPEITKKLFEVIRRIEPKNLFIIADGPRKDRENEVIQCKNAQDIFKSIDWDCEIQKNYSETNLGCKKRISTGLDWAFSKISEAIILEDDCIPNIDFFRYCEELLDVYRYDRRIMAISGDNFQLGRCRNDYSYYFSKYSHCWGWATWRRAWQYYDVDIKLWPEIRRHELLKEIFDSPCEKLYWDKKFQQVYKGSIDSWAYQWFLACWLNHGLTVLPNVNLVSNIGFSISGTHTRIDFSPFSKMETSSLEFPIKHPPFIVRDVEADRFTHNNMFSLTSRALYKLQSIFYNSIR